MAGVGQDEDGKWSKLGKRFDLSFRAEVSERF